MCLKRIKEPSRFFRQNFSHKNLGISEIVLIFATEIQIFEGMNANIDISYSQMLSLLQQMPIRSQLRIGRTLTQQNIRAELNHFLQTFQTDEIAEEDILAEVKSVRRKRYAKKV